MPLRLVGLRQMDLEDSVLEFGFGLIEIQVLGQANRAVSSIALAAVLLPSWAEATEKVLSKMVSIDV